MRLDSATVRVADESFLRLVTSWITNPAVDSGKEVRPRRGVPQGAPISQVFANLCLTPLDRWMESRGLDYVRYADDFVALCASEEQARKTVAALEEYLARELALAVKPSKTMFVSVAEGFDFLGFSISESGVRIRQARVEESKVVIANLLASKVAEGTVVKDLDSYVRGFRNYFDLGLPGTTEQLQSLEAERNRQLTAWAQARRLDLALIRGASERFLLETPPEQVPGAYEGIAPAPADDEVRIVPRDDAQTTSLEEVDRRPAAVRSRMAGGRPAAVNASGHLEVFGFGAHAGLEEERLVLRRKREVIFEAPLAALRTIQIDSYGIALTTPLLERLAEHDVPVLFTRHGERPWAVLRPLTARGSADLLRAQVLAHGLPLGIEIAIELIAAKLTNQERLLRYYAKYKRRRDAPSGQGLRDAAGRVASIAGELRDLTSEESGDPATVGRRIFSIEGRAGAA